MKFFSIITLFVVIFSSCQKDFSVENNINNDLTTITDSSYVDKIVYIDSSGTRLDSLMYNYDIQKRLISIFDSSSSSNYNIKNFLYSGNDTLPFKVVETNKTISSGFFKTTKYFSYNTIGLLIKDSCIRIFQPSDTSVRVGNYTYNGNKIFGITYDTGFSQKTIWVDTATLDIAKNIVFSKRKKIFDLNNFSSYPDSSKSKITYDNKIGAFAKFKQFAHDIFPNGETSFFEIGQNNNVLIMDEYIYYGFFTYPYTYDFNALYVYNINGLPKQISGNDEKFIFYYKNF